MIQRCLVGGHMAVKVRFYALLRGNWMPIRRDARTGENAAGSILPILPWLEVILRKGS